MKTIRGMSVVLMLGLLASCEAKFEWPWLKAEAAQQAAISGPSREVSVSAFDTIRFEGVGDLVLDTSLAVGTVKITSEKNQADKLLAEVSQTTLVLKSRDGNAVNSGKAEYRVNPGSGLTTLVLKGLGQISSVQPWTGKTLLLQIEGLGQIQLDLSVGDLKIEQHGAGQVVVKGKADTLEVDASGLGHVDAENLVATNAAVHSSGLGEVRVNATGKLDVESSGMGAVRYKGHPTSKNTKSTGATSIEEIQ